MDIRDIMAAAPVIPVITIEREADAIPMARALVAGGLPVLEVTLRTPVALAAIAAMRTVAGAIVGAGTLLAPEDFARVEAAGAQFAVSPGLTSALAEAGRRSRVPLLPGVATASELMNARAAGFTALKFFPAESAGGAPMLSSFAPVFQDVVFCPTGGITRESAPRYLKLANVRCVGGSWVTPAAAVKAGDWAQVEALARDAAALERPAG
jgi:2-dehydro-3-deoxyphosphogluconate aldolase / (4S)-4-hydroxy-2-oxoglutarate aldolase